MLPTKHNQEVYSCEHSHCCYTHKLGLNKHATVQEGLKSIHIQCVSIECSEIGKEMLSITQYHYWDSTTSRLDGHTKLRQQ